MWHLDYSDSLVVIGFAIGTISFLLSVLSVVLLYLTRRKRGFTTFNYLILHQFFAQICFDMSNVMLLFNFIKGFGPAHEDDDIYYTYYNDDDKVSPYVVGWEVGVTFFYNFGTYQTTFWGFIIMAITCYMITKQVLLDLKQLYPFLVGFGTILPLLIAFLRIFLYSPLGNTNYFYSDSGPSPLYFFATILRNICVIGMLVFYLMFYYWEKESESPDVKIDQFRVIISSDRAGGAYRLLHANYQRDMLP